MTQLCNTAKAGKKRKHEPLPVDQTRTFGNRDAEAALCHFALTIGSEAIDTLGKVEPGDFYWEDTRFVFGEVLAMIAAGGHTGDAASLKPWFAKPEVIERMRAAKLDDWFSVEGKPEAFGKILDIFLEPEKYSGLAPRADYMEWYLAELRRWRVARGLRMLSLDVEDRIAKNPDDAAGVLAWTEQQVANLRRLMPEAQQ